MMRLEGRGFKTGGGKMSLAYGAEQLATEFANGKWTFPGTTITGRMHPEIAALLSELVAYNPVQHCGDRVSALLMVTDGAKAGDTKIQSFRLNLMGR